MPAMVETYSLRALASMTCYRWRARALGERRPTSTVSRSASSKGRTKKELACLPVLHMLLDLFGFSTSGARPCRTRLTVTLACCLLKWVSVGGALLGEGGATTSEPGHGSVWCLRRLRDLHVPLGGSRSSAVVPFLVCAFTRHRVRRPTLGEASGLVAEKGTTAMRWWRWLCWVLRLHRSAYVPSEELCADERRRKAGTVTLNRARPAGEPY